MPPIDFRVSPSQLKAIRSRNDAIQLFARLGYDAASRPVDTAALGLHALEHAHVIRSGRTRRSGYGLLIGEARNLPRSLRPLARTLQREVHDEPLAIVGLADADARWKQMIIFRPRQVGGRLGATTVTRLDVDLARPTGHDSEVISGLRWRSDLSEAQAQAAVSLALDVEAVTDRFYKGLKPRFDALERAVDAAAARSMAKTEAINAAGGARRVAIRILTQVLFCYFLQRKGLLAGDRDYLSRAYSQHAGLFYPSVLEPLFYDTLAVPKAARRAAAAAAIPFLNGGLFERRYGEVSLDLPDAIFDLDNGLLGYLNHWTFTVAEETADEAEVAVDPEMLGRIFESLLPDAEREQKGTYYTPRPVVQFMCREALIARLGHDSPLPENILRTIISDEDPLATLREGHTTAEIRAWARTLDERLARLTALDPAVGSGAFLLGMLGEIVRLRGIAHLALHDRAASDEMIHAWKLHAIERSLFGVDIEPTAVELCRLRLWLSLMVELDVSRPVPPLPNLEYRTLCANSLVDYVEGIPIQDTRRTTVRTGNLFGELAADHVIRLRADYFNAADPNRKAVLRGQLLDAENKLLDQWLKNAQAELPRKAAARARLDTLRSQLRSPDRIYPVFMPGFSAPDVWTDGGWDIVIMNPPYVGRKEIPLRRVPYPWSACTRSQNPVAPATTGTG